MLCYLWILIKFKSPPFLLRVFLRARAFLLFSTNSTKNGFGQSHVSHEHTIVTCLSFRTAFVRWILSFRLIVNLLSSTAFCLLLLLSKYLWPLSCVNWTPSIPPKRVGFIIFYPFPVRYRAKTGQNNFQTHTLILIRGIVFRRRKSDGLTPCSLSSHKIWKPPNSKEHSFAD